MTLAETLEMVRQHLAYDLDAYTDATTDAVLLPAINWAIRGVAQRAKLTDASIPVTLIADMANYDLRTMASDGRAILKPTRFILTGRPLRTASGDYGLWAMTELERQAPTWRLALSGTPTKAVFHGTRLILNPPPDASTVTAGNHFISGTYLPAPMVEADADEELPLPIEVHEAVCYLAALRLATPTVTEAQQMERLRAFAAGWADAVEELARTNDASTASWGTTRGDEGDEYLWL